MDVMDITTDVRQEDVSKSNPPTRTIDALSKLMESDSDSEKDEQPVQRAPSKLLARLQPQMDAESSESSDEEDDGNAYERVRKALMSAPTDAQKEEPTPVQRTTEALSSDDDEEMPVQRRRISRREKSSSPRVSSSGSTRSRTRSPGLFVTPDASPVKRSSQTTPTAENGHNKDLEERVRRIRAERLALQKKERQHEQRSKKSARREPAGPGSDSDENDRRLTQSSRPTRRAGKKALEDIAREQQRISRNMQLTHQAKTKKKYSIKDLFPKLGFAQEGSEVALEHAIPTPDASSVMASSDGERHGTPPSSPPSQAPPSKEESLSTLSAPSKQDKGKGRAPEYQHLPPRVATETPGPIIQKTQVDTEMIELSDSEDDTKIPQPRKRFAVFDKLPQAKNQEASSLLVLRHLAHLTSPGNSGPKGRKTMNMAQLQLSLGQKAREQAHREREEKIEDLRRRGIHVETEEEREKHQLEIEDLVAQFEKARQEDLNLTKLERAEAKKNGERDDLPSSDESEDDDYVGSGEEDADVPEETEEGAELELSGSEEEDMGEDDEEEDDMETSHGLVDDAAEESHEELDEADVEEEVSQPRARKQNGKRSRNVVIDEEDEDETIQPPPIEATPVPSQTQEDDTMAAFGFNTSSGGLGLTQMFASTMANLNSDAHPLDQEPEQDSMDFFRSLPDTQPGATFTVPADLVVPNSQTAASQQDEAPIHLGISQLVQTPAFPQTQLVEDFEPTQDAGFELSRSPAGLGQPASTIDTVMMSVAESPIAKRKGRLHRGRPMVTELSDIDDDADVSEPEADEVDEGAETGDAFAILKKSAQRQKRLADKFNKKTSWARDAVQEQAEESEDEYAGLGGASDEDSGEEDEELAKMIDTNDVKVDERKIAAYFAEKMKYQDEKDVNQLYRDLMNGGLRKRRGGDAFDVSDPEDEIEQRRRKKRQQFQQMTKALISDEKIGKIAQNPKQAAFFKTLADHTEDPDYDFLDAAVDMDVAMDDSQSPSDEVKEVEEGEGAEVTVPDSQAADGVAPPNVLKRKSLDSQEKENRPPPHLRRTAAPDNMSRRPMTLADVQHSVSELLEDPRIMVPDSQFSDSDSELEIEPPVPAAPKQIVDRLTMKAEIAVGSASDGHLAFHAPTAGAYQPGFRIPALVRRATSNLSAVSTSTSGTTTPVEGSGVRRGGTGRSNIHAQAREAERRAALEKVEKKRKESLKKKVGKAQGKSSILRCLDTGFE